MYAYRNRTGTLCLLLAVTLLLAAVTGCVQPVETAAAAPGANAVEIIEATALPAVTSEAERLAMENVAAMIETVFGETVDIDRMTFANWSGAVDGVFVGGESLRAYEAYTAADTGEALRVQKRYDDIDKTMSPADQRKAQYYADQIALLYAGKDGDAEAAEQTGKEISSQCTAAARELVMRAFAGDRSITETLVNSIGSETGKPTQTVNILVRMDEGACYGVTLLWPQLRLHAFSAYPRGWDACRNDDFGAALPVSAPETSDAALPAMDFPTNEPTGAADEVVVSTVDQLLAAIGSDRTIFLTAGTYVLSQAGDYGKQSKNPAYAWVEEYDGYELVVRGVHNLSIVGCGANDVALVTAPRYADVLSFSSCSGISVNGVTAGHTEGAGDCTGAVLCFASSDTIFVVDCDLYGCGTYGVEADRCADIRVENSALRDCSLGAVSVANSRYVRIEDCQMTGSGTAADPAFALLSLRQSNEVAILNCAVSDNVCMRILESTFSKDVQLLGCEFSRNQASEMAICAVQYSPVIAGCSFADNAVSSWYAPDSEYGEATVQAVSESGDALSADDLLRMRRKDIPYEAPAPAVVAPETTVAADGTREVRVKNVDELLAAIASDTTVYLADGVYDWSQSADYGVAGTGSYYWENIFDGPGLVVSEVTNFHIVGNGADKASIVAIPRYADVLAFDRCQNVSVTGVTLGHSEAPGECTGGVLRFAGSNTVSIQDCALFGCGILGVEATESGAFTIDHTEIYDCSNGAVLFRTCHDIALTNCDIHDCGEPTFSIIHSTNVTNDGKPVRPTTY